MWVWGPGPPEVAGPSTKVRVDRPESGPDLVIVNFRWMETDER